MTLDKLMQVFPGADDEDAIEFISTWEEFAHMFGVKTEHHEDMLLATILNEVGSNLKSVRENLNYTPSALRSTFSRYRNNPNWSERDGRTNEHSANQVNIGDIAYADRLGNGDIESGDGYKFRGGSYIQTTGRYNWEESARTINSITSEHLDAGNLEDECHRAIVGLLMTFAFFFENNIASCMTMNCCTDKVNMHTSSRAKRNEDYEWISKL